MSQFLRLLALWSVLLPWATAQNAPLIDILDAELKRNFQVLKEKADPPPYFLSYEVVDEDEQLITSTLGALQNSGASNTRTLDVTVRVGSPELDNYHRLRGDAPVFTRGVTLPLEDNPNAIRRSVWLETNRIYNLAAQRLIRVKANTQVKAAEEDTSADFSVEEPVAEIGEPARIPGDLSDWAPKLRKWSAAFSKHEGVLASNVTLMTTAETKYLVNTEGTRLRYGRTFARILISARGKSGDGMDLAATETFEAETPDRLPKEDVIQKAVEKVAVRLVDLLHAQPVDPYVGPAILSGSAAGVFFHEIFGHRVEGHRQKDESEGQTFTKSLNQEVLPTFLSVIFDPTRKTAAGVDLSGWYPYDDEGVKARPVTVVENGILKTFLMSRSPIRGFDHSNGHGRRQAGREVVSRQSNLLVDSSKTVPRDQLRALLLEEMKKQNKPYGLYFEQVTGGYTTTGRSGLQAFTVIPLVVYRVHADGKPDELVRGVNIVGTPLASFAKIIAASEEREVFNGICGAESGGVPVSAVSPALLVSEIEVQRKPGGLDTPPTLPRPSASGEVR